MKKKLLVHQSDRVSDFPHVFCFLHRFRVVLCFLHALRFPSRCLPRRNQGTGAEEEPDRWSPLIGQKGPSSWKKKQPDAVHSSICLSSKRPSASRRPAILVMEGSLDVGLLGLKDGEVHLWNRRRKKDFRQELRGE